MSNRRLRVLHVVFSLDPGGMENGLVNVAGRLPAAEFEAHVCCLERRGAFADRLPVPANVTVLDKPPGRSPRTIVRLHRLMRRLRPDVVHTHDLGPLVYGCWASLGGRLAPLLQGEHVQFPAAEQTPRRLRQRRFYYRFCRRLHTVAQALRPAVAALAPGRPVDVVANGVDTERFQPRPKAAARAALGLPPTGVVIGEVARLVPHKRQAEMIEALSALLPVYPDLQLVLAGDGPDAARLAAQAAQLPNRERVRLLGYVGTPEVVYNALDLLVIPSLYEGLSNVMLEAMACGVPVLTHEVSGSRRR